MKKVVQILLQKGMVVVVIFYCTFILFYLDIRAYFTFNYASDTIAFLEQGYLILLIIALVIDLVLTMSLLKGYYDIFSKKYPNSRTRRKKRYVSQLYIKLKRIGIALLIGMNLICFSVPFFPRYELKKDGTIYYYNIVNQRKSICTVEDYETVLVQIEYYNNYFTPAMPRAALEVIIYTNSKKYRFSLGDFRDYDSVFNFVESINSDRLEFRGQEHYEKLIKKTSFSPEQLEKLSNYFGVEG